jgi:hypothetical protein
MISLARASLLLSAALCAGNTARSAHQAESAQGVAEHSQPPKQEDKSPSLDDLLGIGEAESDAAVSDAERARRETLTRSLTPGEAQSTLEAAIKSMQRSADLLRGQEKGLAVQRLQEDALSRLDSLIDSAQRQQQRQGASSRSSQGQSKGQQSNEGGQKQQGSGSKPDSAEAQRRREANERARQGQQSQGAKGAQGEQAGGDGNRPGEAPAFEGAVEGGVMEESEAEWGNLPPRTREILRQGSRERMSSVYRRMTEAYYRRIAQEAKK